jgi:hypothetical protein
VAPAVKAPEAVYHATVAVALPIDWVPNPAVVLFVATGACHELYFFALRNSPDQQLNLQLLLKSELLQLSASS